MSATRYLFPRCLVCAAAFLTLQSASFANPVPDASIVSDRIIVRIDDGDFVHPAFSPDGRRLAYAGTIVRNKTELTEVFIRDLDSGATWRLLDADTSRKYAIYKAFIYKLEWASDTRLIASVSDGDVGTVLVEFDVDAQRIVNERGDYDGEAEWYADIERRMRLVKPLPGWDPDVLRNAFENSIELEDGSFLIQPQYAGVAPDVFHITRQGQLTQLTRLDKDAFNALCGGLLVGDSVLFLLANSRTGNSRTADLLRYRKGRIEKLDTITTLTEPQLHRLDTARAYAVFFVSTGYAYQRSPGKLYEYRSGTLRTWPSPAPLHTVAIDSVGRKLSLVMWDSDRRIIEVREMRSARAN